MSASTFHTVGIGVTFSPNLKANLYEAARLSLLFEGTLILIHVGEASEDKRTQFSEILEPFTSKGLSYTVVFQPGEPVSSILQIVVQEKIDLLILGALQRENILNYYIGSIARKITRNAPCSLLLLINPSIERIPCKHIVVNGLQDAKTERTIATAFSVGCAFETEKLTIVEEITQAEVAVNIEDDRSLRKADLKKEQLRRREDSRIQQILDQIPTVQQNNISVKTQPIFGKRGYSIGHFAQVVRADLLVMNAQKKSGFLDRLFPHDLEHILTELPTDVLIIQ